MPRKNRNWNVNKGEFQGYMKAKMESIDDNIGEIKKNNESIHKKVDKLEEDVTKLKVTSGILGSISGFVGGFAGAITRGFFKR